MSSYGDGAAKTRMRKTVTQRTLDRRARAQERASRAKGLDIGWTVFSYLIGGMIGYGAIGWLIGKAVHAGWPFPVGMLTGLAISVGFVIYRYGRQGSVEQLYGRQGPAERNDR